MDPNSGDIRDAILVHCDMETRSTCVLPAPAETPVLSHHRAEEDGLWLSEMSNGMKVTRIIFVILLFIIRKTMWYDGGLS